MISVIIPTWNEEKELPRTLAALPGSEAEHEVLVVDSGSEDDSRGIAEQFGATVYLSAERQRAFQMNLGAQHARGDVYLFLHADTMMPAGGLDRIRAALKDTAIGGGAFARRFESRSMAVRCTCLLAEIRNRTIGWHLGDQGIFARAEFFKRIGGYRLIDRFEDLDFSRRLGRTTGLVTLRPPVVSSARRFEAGGPWRRTMRDFVLTMKYLQGRKSATTRS